MAIKPHRVLEVSFIGDSIRQVGEIVDYEEKDASSNLEKVSQKEAAKAQAEVVTDAAVAPV